MTADCRAEHLNDIYPFHKVNVHEDRLAAIVFRTLPLASFIILCVLSIVGLAFYKTLLLVLCAILNTLLWCWITATALLGIIGALTAERQIQFEDDLRETPSETGVRTEFGSNVSHMIVFPNYKEDLDMLDETLKSLSEAKGAESFRVVMGMEAREEEAIEKSKRLEKYKDSFKWLLFTFHPKDLTEIHLDGTVDDEVPGKASNLKWAVTQGKQKYAEEKKLDNAKTEIVILTVADADCIFHPSYFNNISRGVAELEMQGNGQHLWTAWQPPQLPFRNLNDSPLSSRVWGYIASVFEAGGVTSLAYGGHHMLFSSYSLPLQLAIEAEAWDGDVIAEDHHCFLKCFFYSIYRCRDDKKVQPLMQVRPVNLPVKSTSVVSSEGYWDSTVARWQQAKRHAQGVAEASYACFATWELLRHFPVRKMNTTIAFYLWRTVLRVVCVHTLPIFQVVPIGLLSLYWFANGYDVPMCPDRLWWADFGNKGEHLLCGLAGAWVLFWPVIVPMALATFSNFLYIKNCFVVPPGTSIWHNSDGGTRTWLCGWAKLALFVRVALDCFLFMGPVMFIFGFCSEILAYVSLVVYGNRMKYVTASKMITSDKSYGTMATTDTTGTDDP